MRARKMKNSPEDRMTAGGVIAAVCLTLFLFTFSVTLVLNLRWLYYLDIPMLKLEEASGMTAKEIRANYDALITYNQVWTRGALAFPTLPMSREGAIHFAEVKRIFDMIQILCLISGILGFVMSAGLRRKNVRRHFKLAGILSLVLPLITGVMVAVSWERFFILFHHIAFRNDYWLFDPATDPVILILPDTYFLQCAVGILLVILAGAVVLLRLGRRPTRWN